MTPEKTRMRPSSVGSLLAIAAMMGAGTTASTEPMAMTIKPSQSIFDPPRRRPSRRGRLDHATAQQERDAKWRAKVARAPRLIAKAEAKRARKAQLRSAHFQGVRDGGDTT